MTTRVARLIRYPVKSVRGETLDTLTFGASGVDGDRRVAVVDLDTGTVLSGKREPKLVEASARIEGDDVVVTMPDGADLRVGDRALDEALTALVGRRVAVRSRSAVEDARYESNVDHMAQELELKLSRCLVPGTFHDAMPVHVLTQSSLREMERLAPGSTWGQQRFRANVLLESADEGFVEDAWIGRVIEIGQVALRVHFAMPRCAFTTRAVEDQAADRDVLRELAKHHDINLGVACTVEAAGAIRAGDELRLN